MTWNLGQILNGLERFELLVSPSNLAKKYADSKQLENFIRQADEAIVEAQESLESLGQTLVKAGDRAGDHDGFKILNKLKTDAGILRSIFPSMLRGENLQARSIFPELINGMKKKSASLKIILENLEKAKVKPVAGVATVVYGGAGAAGDVGVAADKRGFSPL